LNFISLVLCIIAILWDSKVEFGTQEKKKTPLFVIAGILAVLGLIFWFFPTVGKAEGSSVYVPLYQPVDKVTGVIPPVDESLRQFSWFTMVLDIISYRLMGLNWAIGFLTGTVIALAISFVSKFRNDHKKALIAAIFYLFSLSVFPTILCFIGYAILKKQSVGKTFRGK